MNRYQKPEIYERLAMEYVVGSMQGRARARFETLMDEYPFIGVTVQEYEQRFYPLLDEVPEREPHLRVWKNIKSSINEQVMDEQKSNVSKAQLSEDKVPWWDWLFRKGYALAAVFLLVSGVYLIQTSVDDQDYRSINAHIVSQAEASPVAYMSASKEVMELSVKWLDEIAVPQDKQAYLWCLPKDGGKPMNMGVLASNSSMQMAIDEKVWKGLLDASQFAISYEPVNSKVDVPSGDYQFMGELVFSL